MHELPNASGVMRQSDRSTGYAEWIALGAVVAGTVGALVGAGRCVGRGARQARLEHDPPESALLTAPHGDKLRPR